MINRREKKIADRHIRDCVRVDRAMDYLNHFTQYVDDDGNVCTYQGDERDIVLLTGLKMWRVKLAIDTLIEHYRGKK